MSRVRLPRQAQTEAHKLRRQSGPKPGGFGRCSLEIYPRNPEHGSRAVPALGLRSRHDLSMPGLQSTSLVASHSFHARLVEVLPGTAVHAAPPLLHGAGCFRTPTGP